MLLTAWRATFEELLNRRDCEATVGQMLPFVLSLLAKFRDVRLFAWLCVYARL